MKSRRPLMALTLSLAGCTTHRAPMVAEVAPPAEIVSGPSLPPGATPGMLVPEALADGSFPTPNQGLNGAAAIWHLRAGLNVAALSCPGVDGAAIRTGYNRWLARDKASLARAAKAYAASYRVKTGLGSYDDAMTRLYNFFSQTPVRPGFCTAAAGLIADMGAVGAVPFADDAASRLASLDQPFVDFYRAYAAWRDGARARPAMPVVIAAVATPAYAAAPARITRSRPAAPVTAGRPTLTLDLSTLPPDSQVIAHR